MVTNTEFRDKLIGERMVWLSTKDIPKRYSRANSDITVTECYTSKAHKHMRYNITFRNEIDKFFGECVDFATYKNRLFLRPMEGREGYKFYHPSKGNPFVQISKNESTCDLTDFVGNYELKYDEFLDLYYIEREETK